MNDGVVEEGENHGLLRVSYEGFRGVERSTAMQPNIKRDNRASEVNVHVCFICAIDSGDN